MERNDDNIEETAEEFKRVLENEELKDCPILVYVNKKDVENGMDVPEIA